MTSATTGSAPRVGWVVDAQVDFMRPDGRLYVRDLQDPSDPGAERAVPALVRAVEWLRDRGAVVVFTGDWHGPEDEEIDPVSPDPARGTYPPHCMGRSADPTERAGAEVIEEIRPRDPLVLPVDAGPEDARRIAAEAVRQRRPVFIQKTRFDVFAGNPATEALLAALEDELGARPELVVAGVARDVCVTQAVDGMLARGYPVTVLEDATWGLGLEPAEATLRRWKAAGGRVTTVKELDALASA
ncbi:MAG TPA: isochorismatase family cysteine hydrolase [Longimicrobiales bacterium]|nr:isochorismatase family cysteine hydrolase [Longimicrobiales bacterium]